MVEYEIPHLTTQLGSSSALGFVIGYGLKQFARVIVVLVGSQTAFFGYLESKGVLTIHWNQFEAVSVPNIDPSNYIFATEAEMFSTIPIISGFVTGIIVGFRLG